MKNEKLKVFLKDIDKKSDLKDSEIIKLRGGNQALKMKESDCSGFACGVYHVLEPSK